MKRRHLGDLIVEWDAAELPSDPIEAVLPLVLDPEAEAALDPTHPPRNADLSVRCTQARAPLGLPVEQGTLPVLLHGRTSCFPTSGGLVVWDGASQLHILDQGRRIEAAVHASSLDSPFFTSVTVTMAVLLSLRHHGYFHLHAAAARWPDGDTWLIPGNAGAGKSTLALALFSAGADWLADDAVLLRDAGGELQVVGWARNMRMTSRTREAFPALQRLCSACAPASTRQWQLDPRQAFPQRGRATASPPYTLVFPRIAGDAAPVAAPLARADAFGRALHACAWVAANRLVARERQLALLGRLVDGARAFELAVGPGLLSAPTETALQLRALLG